MARYNVALVTSLSLRYFIKCSEWVGGEQTILFRVVWPCLSFELDQSSTCENVLTVTKMLTVNFQNVSTMF